MLNRLTNSLDFQGEALMLRAERQRVVASNIANADTPGYQARDFDFSAALREATSQLPSNALGGTVVGDRLGDRNAAGRYEPRLNYAVPSQTNLDRNTVDMDRERAAFADNAVKYESTLRFINGSVRTMLDAMRSHNG